LGEVFAVILVRTSRREHSHESSDEDLAQIATRGVPIGAVVRECANPLGILARCSRHLDHPIRAQLTRHLDHRTRARLIGENGAYRAHVQYDGPSGQDLTGRWLGRESHRQWVRNRTVGSSKESSTWRAIRAIVAQERFRHPNVYQQRSHRARRDHPRPRKVKGK